MLISALLTQITRRIASFVQNKGALIKFSMIATSSLGFMSFVQNNKISIQTGLNVLSNVPPPFDK